MLSRLKLLIQTLLYKWVYRISIYGTNASSYSGRIKSDWNSNLYLSLCGDFSVTWYRDFIL